MHGVKRVLSPSKSENTNSSSASTSTLQKHKKLRLQCETTTNIAAAAAESSVDQENYDFLLDDSNDFDFSAFDAPPPKHRQLDLTTWQRCIVRNVERLPKTFELALDLAQSDDENSSTTCHLQGPWSHTHIKSGDLVSIKATWVTTSSRGSHYAVNKDAGYCVVNPDMLLSSTSVTGSLFCRRKAVLQERFRGVDSANAVMVIGSLVHELFQAVLTNNLHSTEEIESHLKRMMESSTMTQMLYQSKLTLADVRLEMEKFVGPIVDFLKQYMKESTQSPSPSSSAPAEVMYQGCITDIEDIEENIWVPQLGLKGKVDVSVRIRRHNRKQDKDSDNDIPHVPLELKTGRASFSMEHKGQLLLYQLMLSAIGRNPDTGLLLYLRDGIMREVNSSHNEFRDLIVLRNELAFYLSQDVQLPSSGGHRGSSEPLVQPFVLPEPISHHSACGNCAYATLCCSFAVTDEKLQLRDSHPLRKVMQQCLEHLQMPDYEYLIRWCGLLALEEQEGRKSINTHALWTVPAAKRQQQKRAICNLQLPAASSSSTTEMVDGRYSHTLQLMPDEILLHHTDLRLSGFDDGEYVIVSTTNRIAIAAGFITGIEKDKIGVQLERDLRRNYKDSIFIIDKHESQSFSVFNYTNLGLLLENTERAAQLRAIVIAHKMPIFRKVLPKIIATQGAEILRQLNKIQRAAALRALTTQNYMLIKGLPGTGKTQTLVAIIRLLHLMQCSILITAQTHSAVDNLLLRLHPYNLPLLRLGATARIHPQLHGIGEEAITQNCHNETQLAERLHSRTIVGVTCLGAAHALFQHRQQFDYCIVDEATQVLQPTVLRALFYCRRFVLVGDPEQLPPLVRSREARQRGADESLFQLLDTDTATSILTLQYRMNRTIAKLANEVTYQGALCCGTTNVELATLQLPSPTPTWETNKWVQRILQTHLEQSVVLVDTKNCQERGEGGSGGAGGGFKAEHQHISKYTNHCEAAVVLHLIRQLVVGASMDGERIGIIAPYRAQVDLLRKLAAHCPGAAQVEFNTVDQYQGRDKDLIIYSCTKTGVASAGGDGHTVDDRHRDTEILEDQRRLTVAITRAKHKLIILGDVQCLQRYTPLRKVFSHINRRCYLQLEDDRYGFSWDSLLRELKDLLESE